MKPQNWKVKMHRFSGVQTALEKQTTLKMFTDLIPSFCRASAPINGGVNVHTNKKAALASVGALIETPEMHPSLTPREASVDDCRNQGNPR